MSLSLTVKLLVPKYMILKRTFDREVKRETSRIREMLKFKKIKYIVCFFSWKYLKTDSSEQTYFPYTQRTFLSLQKTKSFMNIPSRVMQEKYRHYSNLVFVSPLHSFIFLPLFPRLTIDIKLLKILSPKKLFCFDFPALWFRTNVS